LLVVTNAVFPVCLRESWVAWVWWELLASLSEWIHSQSFIKYLNLCTLVKLFGRILRLHVGCLTVRVWLGWLQYWGLCLVKYWIQRFCYCVFAIFIISFLIMYLSEQYLFLDASIFPVGSHLVGTHLPKLQTAVRKLVTPLNLLID
jgi:hypothetical protein